MLTSPYKWKISNGTNTLNKYIEDSKYSEDCYYKRNINGDIDWAEFFEICIKKLKSSTDKLYLCHLHV